MLLVTLLGSCKPDWKLNPAHVADQLNQAAAENKESKMVNFKHREWSTSSMVI
jgi:hypothetical protein